MRTRLMLFVTAPVIATSGLLIAVGAGAGWYVHHANKNVTDLLSQNLASNHASEKLVLGIRDARNDITRFLNSHEPAELEAASAMRRVTQRELDGIEQADTPAETRQLVAGLRINHARFFERLEEIKKQPFARDTDEAIEELITDVTSKVLDPSERLLEVNRDAASRTNQRSVVIADRIGLSLVLLGVCGAAAGLLAGFGMARGLRRSIVQLSLPIRDTAGQLNDIVGPIAISANADLAELETVMRTITERTTAVINQLKESQYETIRADQLAVVGQLAAGMAHELRNPLMSIKILVQSAALRRDAVGMRGRDLEVVEEEITRLEKLIHSFLEFARPSPPDKRELDVRELIDQTIRLVSARASQQQVRIDFQQPEQAVMIAGDPNQIRQVLLNLVLNAIDAMGDGGTVRLRVDIEERADRAGKSTRSAERAARWVVIRVADDGPGVQADVEKRLFEPFVTTKETGMGLGLAICRRIVESHDGRIAGTNRDAGGAEFTIRLPLVRVADVLTTDPESMGA